MHLLAVAGLPDVGFARQNDVDAVAHVALAEDVLAWLEVLLRDACGAGTAAPRLRRRA